MKHFLFLYIVLGLIGCDLDQSTSMKTYQTIEVYQTSANGDQFKKVSLSKSETADDTLTLFPKESFQTILGIGGAFTESSAYLLNQISNSNRNEILEAYFGENGAKYSFCRTHINSCDFSLSNYSYDSIPGDTELTNFSIDHDRQDLIPMIQGAMKISKEGFKLIASPWTAPPWMKDNNAWNAGSLKEKYYPSWALYFDKYIKAYEKEGVPIWGVTVENEPLGNDSNWESMHYTPEQMADFVKNHLGPLLKTSAPETKIYFYDQNRDQELIDWTNILLKDKELDQYFTGTAVHWYASTYNSLTKALDSVHQMAPNKSIIHSEACIDNDIPRWKDDAWYWSKEASDWGYQWAREEDKYLHPKYVPVHRYASDIIECLNHWVEGWIDWNMVLNKQGGPNHAKNWCIAPIIVDEQKNEVYYTPLYYTMMHFSKFIRPNSVRIGFSMDMGEIMATAVKNQDNSIAIVLFNPTDKSKTIQLGIDKEETLGRVELPSQSIQSIILK